MARDGWHILREGGTLTLARHLPARFDLSAQAVFPPARKGRLASQVRQDLWRELQSLRGFSPVVRVEDGAQGVTVTAGGRATPPFPRASLEAAIAELLASPDHRARWMSHAGLEAE